ISYDCGEIYPIITDVKSYPEFLPYCLSTKILDRRIISSNSNRATQDGGERVKAIEGVDHDEEDRRIEEVPNEMDVMTRIGYKGFETDYLSRVICEPLRSVQVVARPSSTFSKLLSTWSLIPTSKPKDSTSDVGLISDSARVSSAGLRSTKVLLELSISFKNPLHSIFLMDQKIWEKFSQKMIDAFEKRINEKRKV
ncbi:hypothetical protein BY996DRAFT_4572589, partial [Phakopsora pachyrhizi]